MKKSDIREKALAERKSWTQQDFELKNVQLLNQIIVDKDFSHTILDVIENEYFEYHNFRQLLYFGGYHQ